VEMLDRDLVLPQGELDLLKVRIVGRRPRPELTPQSSRVTPVPCDRPLVSIPSAIAEGGCAVASARPAFVFPILG
jgi:hypothetical protein